MKKLEKIRHFYKKQIPKKYSLGFSPTVKDLSLDDVVKGTWSLREENGKVFVDVKGSVDLSKKNLSRIPWNFGVVTKDFNCSCNQLKTLEGSPEEVGGNFFCHSNRLKTLRGGPQKIKKNFYCDQNQLQTLEGAPFEVGGDLCCDVNQLKTLKGAPKKIGGDFYCDYNHLKTLEGSPREVGGDFCCHHNQLETLGGAPEVVKGNFRCHNNPVKFTAEDIQRAQVRSRIKNTMSSSNRENVFL